MKTRTRWVIAAAICALAAGTLVAQGQGRGQGRGGFGGGFGFGGPFLLVVNKDVLEDIKATDKQKTKLADWAKEEQPKLQAKVTEKLQDVPMEERPQKRAAIMAELNKELWKSVEQVLKPEQYTRVRQIGLQAMGVRAFSDKDTAEKLKLDDGQKEKIKTITDEMQQAQIELFQNSGITFGQPPEPEKQAELTKKTTELTKKTFGKVKELLNDDQKKNWTEMTGKEFDIAKLVPQFGRGRGGL